MVAPEAIPWVLPFSEIKAMNALFYIAVCALVAWNGNPCQDSRPTQLNPCHLMSESIELVSNQIEVVNLTDRQVENFWRKVDEIGPPHPYDPSLGNCWKWIGGICSGGYGTFWADGKVRSAHRVSLVIHGQDLIVGLDVIHSCDRAFCVNPSHLSQGTTKRNVRECIERGRHISPCGVKSGKARLDDDKVREIRRLFEGGSTKLGLSKQFGVARSVIQSVLWGKTWKHVV